MGEELKGDYKCDKCGYTTHNPTSRICHSCGGELVYMMTWQDEIEGLTKEHDQLEVEEECIWKLTNYGKSEESCDYGEDVYIGEYTCTDGWYQGHKPDYVFCPNCGRRIKYEEEEK